MTSPMDGIQIVVIVMLIPALTGALPAWKVQPVNFTSVVQGEHLTLTWEYKMDGTFEQVQFSHLTDAGKEKSVAVKSSMLGNVVVASEYQERFKVRISDSQTTVKILRAKKADLGKYKLEVINKKLKKIDSVVEVSVYYPPANTVLSVFPNSSEVLGGSVLYEECYTDANPGPHIFLLYFNGNLIRNSSSGEFNVTVDSDGVYTCAPINTVGSGDNASFSVTIVGKPIIASEPKSVTPLVGEATSLRCLAYGSPPLAITWARHGVGNGSELFFPSARFSDRGWYGCVAKNGHGVSFSSLAYLDVTDSASTFITGRVTITNENFDNSLENPASMRYQTIKRHFVEAVGEVFKNDVTFHSTDVTRFENDRKGTVNILFVLAFKEAVLTERKITLLKIAAREGKLGVLDVDPASVMVIRETEEPVLECNFGCRPSRSPESLACSCDNKIFRAVTGILVLIIIGLLIYVFFQHRRSGIESKERSFEMAREETRRRPPGHEISITGVKKGGMLANPKVADESVAETPETEADTEPINTGIIGYDLALPVSKSSWKVPRENVTVRETIGKGAFSQVARGTVTSLHGASEVTVVAVKMLKENAPASDRKDLLSELDLMQQLKPHPYVIKLLGFVADPLLVLTEYVPFGDLLGYLRKSRGLNDTYYSNPKIPAETTLTADKLMKFAWQIADGMNYLSSKCIIHRDLAARNVLVGENENCKVTDFGMARDVQQDTIYEMKTMGRLPIKWTAYESLCYGTYTTKSDVWSYGIVLYEIFTLGGSPYPGMEGKTVPDWLKLGYRMPKPVHIDDKLYQVMLECWQFDARDRPTFSDLTKKIKKMENQRKRLIHMTKYDKTLYVNVDDSFV
ncbi:fibroblast growth factor receptor 4-like isoform X2 [Stylophora pistillata]|uniref:fibroblast growth factor receptor 4-like isoform X2 n=1 Tax=Stylophora pistillata TaxID=50429 RepID=UPI000C04D22F|nr:fibroblast growth factor receptor 4-like isoform X2 [Stylophora pistillata]